MFVLREFCLRVCVVKLGSIFATPKVVVDVNLPSFGSIGLICNIASNIPGFEESIVVL